MAGLETIARINPRSVSEPTIPATRATLTAQDILGALNDCRDRVGALLLMLRIADHWGVYHDLFIHVRRLVVERSRHERWHKSRYHTQQTIDGIAQHAILEHCFPSRCPRCKGRGLLYPTINGQAATRECPRCCGTGGITSTDESRAAGIGIPVSSYRKYWADKYRRVCKELIYHDAEAARQYKMVS